MTDNSAAPAKRVRKAGKMALTTLDLYALDRACIPVWNGIGHTYLVGTAHSGPKYRDVDVRTILADDEFDRLFGEGRSALWEVVCFAVGRMLAQQTGLPIDYQIQRRTQANEKYGATNAGNRNPLGMGGRKFAGGGDATLFTEPKESEDAA